MTTRRLRSISRALAVLLLGALVFPACPDPVPLPLAGWAEYQDLLFARVPGGSVNVGGGNFHTRRTDLSLDTRVGTYAIGAVYNSATGGWRWAHEMTYAGVTFVDESGASFDLTGIAAGSPIPGTHWVRLDADSMKTKGGLVHDFSASGKLAAIHWLGFDYPRLRFTTGTIGGTERVTAIDQCTAATTCSNLFTLTYTASAELETVTDSAGRTASFTWDAGRLATAKDGLDQAKGWPGFRYEYVGTNLTAIVNSENERSWYTYDSAARLKTAAKFGDDNPTWTFDYFAQTSGLYWTRLTNPLGEVTHFRFDGLRRLGSLELASVSETTTFLWSDRRVSRITRSDGVQTNFQITNDDVTQVSEASGNVTTISYAPSAIDPGNPRGRPVDVVSDSLGLALDRGYDLQGRLTSAANGAGDATTYTWATGSPTALASLRTPAGVLTTFSGHGAHGHPGSATTGPLSQSYTYDAMGNLLSGPDTDTELSPGMGGVESRAFDPGRNVASVSLEAQVPSPTHSETLTLETRSDGLLKAIRRPYGGDTEFDYSATGRVLARREKANSAWVATSFGYDPLDRITSTELANGMRSELGYDGAGRIRSITSKRSGQVEETLTRTFSNGRLAALLDSAYSGPETYAYDAAGRVSTISYPGGERREFGYDLRSRVTSEHFLDAAGETVLELTYAYDLANRVTEIRRQPFNLLQLKYTYTNGFVTQTDYGNGLRRTATVNASFGLPLTTVTTNPQSQVLEDTQNDYGNGLIVARGSTIAGSEHNEAFGTWSEWRLDTAIQDWNGTQAGYEDFRWDSLSNFRGGSGMVPLYNAEANRLLQVRDAAPPNTIRHTYAYDVSGFVTDRDGVAFGYDATGAIASIGTVAAFDHDLDGRPVSRTLNGVTKHFRFGGAIAYSTAGNPIEMDLGEIVIKLDGTGNRYRHLDFRGNVLFQTNNAGGVTGHALYRGFGRSTTSGNVGERGFAGGFEIPSLGLVVLGPRVLDADTARFLSQDPVFNAVNQYAYAQGNPVFFWDPTGRLTATQVGFGIAAVAGGALAVAAISAAPVTITGAIVAAALPTTAAKIAAAIGGGVLGMAAANLVAEAANPAGERMSGGNMADWVWDNLPLTGLFPDTTGGTSGVGSGGSGAGGGGGGGIHGPKQFRVRKDIIITPEGNLGGDGFGGLGGLTFSIAISFAGAGW